MGNIYIVLGGGGGISSDEANAVSSHVLAGKTYLGADTNDDIGIGTMPNNPAQNVSLNCGQSVTVPLGYNPGSIITANSLASQTGGATADDSKVLSSYTYWKDGIKRTGNLSVTSVVSFNIAQYSNLTLIASWAKPSRGPWSGLRVICKQGSYPSNANDGTLFYEGSGTSATKSLAAGTWYFRAWNYITTNAGRIYGDYIDKAVTNSQVRGQKIFTSSGTFKVPANVYKIEVFCVGGGGRGQNGRLGGEGYNPSGGAGGGYTNTGSYSVSPGQSFSVVIGAGGGRGGGASSEGGAGYKGGTTSVSGLITAAGGNFKGQAGSGGSGGGVSDSDVGYNGGSDGSDGGGYYAGTGQHKTTRAFGESTGTLYAGGGGGGSYYGTHGAGGAGGGGNGGGGNGSTNTGGGGGGGKGASYESGAQGGDGGSGITIIRWGY